MIHNPEHRIAKMMRELGASDEYLSVAWSLFHRKWHCIASVSRIRRDVVTRSQKRERCVRQALKQVRKIRGKK